MKKYIAIYSIVTVLFSFSANALDLNKAISGTADATCVALAADLVKSAGEKTVELFTKLEENAELTAADLGVSEKVVAEVMGYIGSGCAKDHLTKAINAVSN